MGQVLHWSATTTEAVRRAIQHSQESMRALARRHGITPKTVAKWKKRESTANRRTGPSVPRSTVIRSIGFFHIDLAEVRAAIGKLYLLVAIDRTAKFAVVELNT